MYNFPQQKMGLKLREGEHLKLFQIQLIKKHIEAFLHTGMNVPGSFQFF